MLKTLRTQIEKLEAMPQVTRTRLAQKRLDSLEKAKLQETAILEKLAKSGIKL